VRGLGCSVNQTTPNQKVNKHVLKKKLGLSIRAFGETALSAKMCSLAHPKQLKQNTHTHTHTKQTDAGAIK